MPNVVRSRQQHTPAVAVTGGGHEEPVAPAYWKPVSPSPIASQLATPSEPTEWKAPVVLRGNRMVGMRYLYARGGVRIPISAIGTGGPDIGQAVWNSDFQPDQVTLRDWGFNDALFQAGYPGFNLGLSFKVQKLPENATGGPGYAMKMKSPIIRNKIQKRMSAGGTYNTTG
jgi:hypothetical protein